MKVLSPAERRVLTHVVATGAWLPVDGVRLSRRAALALVTAGLLLRQVEPQNQESFWLTARGKAYWRWQRRVA